MGNEAATGEVPSVRPLVDMVAFTFKLYALVAALKLDVWAHVTAGQRTAEAVARAAGCDPVGMRRLLDAMCGMGLLDKQDGLYCLTPIAEYYLVAGKPTYRGAALLHELGWDSHGQLADAICTGRRPLAANWASAEAETTWAQLAAQRMAAPGRGLETLDGLLQALEVAPRDGLRVLDVACGRAVYSLAIARKHPGVRLMLQDMSAVVKAAVQTANNLGIGAQVTALPGDLHAADFGREQFDVVIMGSILHFFNPAQVLGLLKRAHAALVPGGMLIVDGLTPDEQRCRREFPLLAGLWLYAACPDGDVYTLSEMTSMLEQARFGAVKAFGEDEGTIRATRL